MQSVATRTANRLGRRASSTFLGLLALLLAGFSMVNTIAWTGPSSHPPSPRNGVEATGPGSGSTLEDRVEITWTADASVISTSLFKIERGGQLLNIVAPSLTSYEDRTAIPGTVYNYCVKVMQANGTETPLGCDDGSRVIARPTGFSASDGLFAEQVFLDWSDRSAIEAGYNLDRDAGSTLNLDGNDDYVAIDSVLDLRSGFTFAFWVSRATAGNAHFLIQFDPAPQTSNELLEIGFDNNDEFLIAFSGTTLRTVDSYPETDWHHWAVSYDGATRERVIYRDGVVVAADVAAQAFLGVGNINIGRRSGTGPPPNRGYFHGQIDEVQLWNVARSSGEIQAGTRSLLSGAEAGLVSYWPLDEGAGTVAQDVVSGLHGGLENGAGWGASGVPRLRVELPEGTSAYADRTAVPGVIYTYGVAAFEDSNSDGRFTEGTDYESERREDDGWRAFVAPPAQVSATDGQFLDRVRITWVDQSDEEDQYSVLRNGTELVTLPADSTLYDDLTAAAGTTYEYCVVTLAGGTQSVPVCNDGMAGGLVPPTDVATTDGTFDDRVQVTWTDTAATEDGFEVFRDGTLVATTTAGVEQYSDYEAMQDVPHAYCVRAFSLANPANPSVSAQVCAPVPGRRAIVLAPEDVTASEGDFEDRVDVAWQNASATAALFKVYREGELNQILPADQTNATDGEIASDVDIEYCVAAVTVPGINGRLTEEVSYVLGTMRQAEVVRITAGGLPTSPEETLAAVEKVLRAHTAGKAASTVCNGGICESDLVCATGSRSLGAPMAVDASDNEFENHVQITWEDNSSFEAGYIIRRGGVVIGTVSAARISFGDYEGAPGIPFSYSVTAFDNRGPGGESDQVENEGQRLLEPPTALQASDGASETEIAITWMDNSAAETGYRIYRREAMATDSTVIAETGKNEIGFADMVAQVDLGKDFVYSVVAFDALGESSPAIDEGNTLILPPTDVNASEVYTDNVVLAWTDVSALNTGYAVYRDAILLDDTLPGQATGFTDLTATGVHDYCVAATSGGGASAEVCDLGALLTPEAAPVGDNINVQSKLPVDVTSNDSFGNSVAIDGDYTIVGNSQENQNTGSAYIFFNDPTSGWTEQKKLTASDGGIGDIFGGAVALEGNHAAVTAPTSVTSSRGSVYLFERNEGGANNWGEVVKLTASDAADSDQFGSSVAIDRNYAIIGARNDDDKGTNSGSAYVFFNNPTSGWTEMKKLTASDGVDQQNFGLSLTIDGDHALVGAPVSSGNIGEGAAYMFYNDPTLGWTQIKKLTSGSGILGDNFGRSVDIHGDHAVVGAFLDDDNGINAGVAYIFARNEGGSDNWGLMTKLTASDTDDRDNFGLAVAIEEDHIVVGAPGRDDRGPFAGKAYIFRLIGGQWNEIAAFLPDDGRGNPVVNMAEQFGKSIALDINHAMAGAPSLETGGAVYVQQLVAAPAAVEASDGGFQDRIQVTWQDRALYEEGFNIFRVNARGKADLIGTASANVRVFDDFSAAPGGSFVYQVTAFSNELENIGAGFGESSLVADIGWRPTNGALSGRVASSGGGGTEDVELCLTPSPNKGLLLDGFAVNDTAEGGQVRIENLALPGGSLSAFTVEFWMKSTDSGSAPFAYAISDANSNTLLIHNPSNFSIWINTTSSGSTGVSANDGQWHHIAATWDNTNGEVKLYKDGVLAATIPGIEAGSTIPAGGVLIFGQEQDDRGGGFEENQAFDGELDEVRLWDHVRDATQVQATMFTPLTGQENGLVSYWPLDQGERASAPDLSAQANHGLLLDGAYWTDKGAPLAVCATTDSEGNYSLLGIRYGESTAFTLTPSRIRREFEPSFKMITLSMESPVQNEVGFSDVTAFTVAGVVQYEDIVDNTTLQCPVPDVEIRVDDVITSTTRADGSYAVSVDPSDPTALDGDPRRIEPRFPNPLNPEVVHTFAPHFKEMPVTDNVFDLNFKDVTRHALTGFFSGGDPGSCGKDIGTAKLRIFTEDGCYDTTIDLTSPESFAVKLPPQRYLVQVQDIQTDSPLRDDIIQFFDDLGTVEVDMTQGPVSRDFIYHAPLSVFIAGLENPTCPNNEIIQRDEEDEVIRQLPAVPIIEEFELVPLIITVEEDYGNGQKCPVEQGTVTIFDAIADLAEEPQVFEVEDGQVAYTTVGASPNVFVGARVDGADRSFQKSISAVGEVEGRETVTGTAWAMVEGQRARTATFISATTEEFPLLVLHDPPGSNSYAFIEEGTTKCERFVSTRLIGGGGGIDIDFNLGFKADLHFTPLGFGNSAQVGGGISLGLRVLAGRDDTMLGDGRNQAICLEASEQGFSTSSDMTWVGEDVFVGVALNLIFAEADNLAVEQCEVNLTESLAMGMNEQEPFETAYVYGESHIELSLIPELENLIELAGGNTPLEGTLDEDHDGTDEDVEVTLQQALENWERHLAENNKNKAEALESPIRNRSFSGGTEFTFTESDETTNVTHFQSTRIFVDTEGHAGGFFVLGERSDIRAIFEIHSEWFSEHETTTTTTKHVGYVLSDGDTGDFFSVDIAKDPVHDTHVFGVVSGRSSNPWEAGTQKRDNPIIQVHPPELHNVDPEGAGSFQLTLINGSESQERRQYTLAVPGETNRGNLGLTVTGDLLGGQRLETFLLEPGEALTINLDVFPSPSAFSYRNVGLMLYPETEFEIWKADPRQPFALSDTAFFSVFFDSTGAFGRTTSLAEGWNWFSINTDGDGDLSLGTVLADMPGTHGDLLMGQVADSRYDSTAGWTGTLTALALGQGYQIYLQQPGLLKLKGDPVEATTPIELAPGWTWIGYLPTDVKPINEALASLEGRARNGDIILSQYTFAQYVEGVGWVGSLTQFVPSQGYRINLADGGTLVYPPSAAEYASTDPEDRRRVAVRGVVQTGTEARINALPATRSQGTMVEARGLIFRLEDDRLMKEDLASGPDGRVAAKRYASSMTLVAEVQHDGAPLQDATSTVSVFSGEELRGVGVLRYVEALDRHLAFVLIHGDLDDEDALEVRVYDGETDAVYENVGTLHYAANTTLGHPAEPLRLDLTPDESMMEELPSEYSLSSNYPNPFNPTTTIPYALPEGVAVRLVVYDVLGRKVTTLVDGKQEAGRYEVVYDASRLATGLYFYRLEAGAFTQVRKMLLLR